jgi:hypothetical protein
MPRHARPGSRSERHEALHRRRPETGQDRRLLGPRVGDPALLGRRRQPAPLQQALDPPHDDGHHLGDVGTGGAPPGDEAQHVPVLRERAVDDQRVHVHVQVQGPAKALNDGDGAAARIGAPSRRTRCRSHPSIARRYTPTTARQRSWSHASR